MAVNWRLRSLISRYGALSNSSLTYREISKETGISTSTLSEINSGNAKRVDLKTLDTLLVYFSEKLGEKLTTDDLLKFTDDEESEDEDGSDMWAKPKAEATPPLPVTVSASESLREVQRKKMLESVPVVEIDPIEAARFEAAKRAAAEAALKRRG